MLPALVASSKEEGRIGRVVEEPADQLRLSSEERGETRTSTSISCREMKA